MAVGDLRSDRCFRWHPAPRRTEGDRNHPGRADRRTRILGFDAETAWQRAIAAAKADLTDPAPSPDKTRPQVVGEACGRLRARGWRIEFVPIGRAARDDTRFVLLEGPKSDLIVRPTAMAVQAFCETLFGLAWAKLPKPRAEEAVGNILERAIAQACAGKADVLLPNMTYEADGKELEVDVAARSGSSITLIEVKAKPLTRAGQTGRHGAFFADYARSYVPMVEQLARHERHVLAGRTPLVASTECVDELRVEKIAVSPVSYGPITDRTLATPLHAALFGMGLEAAEDVEATKAAIRTFNKAIQRAQREMALAGTIDAEGCLDVFNFFLFTHWVDLGQLLYALHRVERVGDALRPVRHATTGSRDFWSEFAHLAPLIGR